VSNALSSYYFISAILSIAKTSSDGKTAGKAHEVATTLSTFGRVFRPHLAGKKYVCRKMSF